MKQLKSSRKLKKYYLATLFVVTLVTGLSLTITSGVSKVSALSGSQFNAGRIIDDGIFFNSNSMTSSQIQSFLNAKVPSCDTNGTKPSGHAGYATRADWGRAHGAPPPYKCLRSYSQSVPTVTNSGSNLCSGNISGGTKTAAQIIYDVGKACSINPQVLIVLLQKEQSLVTDDWPWPTQYRSATGYGCPDTAPCDSEYYGFFNQVYQAAQAYRRYQANPTNYNYRFGRNNTILWNPNAACGSSTVFIQNQATAGLYIYTPYRPNAAALNNLYGTGDSCSSYGNRNFWRFFNDWFGSTQFAQPVGAQIMRQSSTGKMFLVTDNTRYYIPGPSILSAYNLTHYGAIASTDAVINSLSDGGSLSTLVSNGGKIYLIDAGSKHYIPDANVCTNWALSCFNTNIVKIIGNDYFQGHLKVGAAINNTALLGNTYYQLSNGKRLPFANKTSFLQAGLSTAAAVSISSYNLAQPLGPLQVSTPGLIKFSPKPTIYYFSGTSYFKVDGSGDYTTWNLRSIPVLAVPTSSYNGADDVPSTSLKPWVSDSSSNKYVLTGSGTKIKIDVSQQQFWPDATYVTGLDTLLSKLPTIPLKEFIKADSNIYKLDTATHKKRYVSGLGDYYELGGTNSNIIGLSGTVASGIESGPFAFPDGRLIKVQNDTTIYVMNHTKLSHVSSMPVLNAYHFRTSNIKVFPVSAVAEYPDGGTLTHGILTNGTAVIAYDRKLIVYSATQVAAQGLDTSSFTDISSALTNRAYKIAASNFYKDISTGRIYYANDGGLHYVSSFDKFMQLGGTASSVIPLDSNTLRLFTLKQPV